MSQPNEAHVISDANDSVASDDLCIECLAIDSDTGAATVETDDFFQIGCK